MKRIFFLVLMFSMFAGSVISCGADKAHGQTLSGMYVSQVGLKSMAGEINYLEFKNEFCRSSIAAGKYTIRGNTLYIEMAVFIPTYGGYASFEIVDPDTIKTMEFGAGFIEYDKGIVFKRIKHD
ncbi:MAG TPA: hypothetical protein PKX40_19730 [Spirochaetota bacterium]|nr:hypothetical protein [Spirochaetota bacterium]